MAVPLIVDVIPRSGPTGGKTLVEIKANNLRVPPDPPLTGQTSGILPQTVQVLFGGGPATGVKVFSKGRLTCLAPNNDPGDVDVTIKNLDDLGVPIVGEEATRVDIYKFRRPNILADADLTRLVRTFIRLLKQQVISEVVLTAHTDFDDDTADLLSIVNIAKLPAIILVGPEIAENRFFSTNEKQEVPLNDGLNGVAIRRPPYTVDLQFEVIGVNDRTRQNLNLLTAMIQFLNRNKFIEMDRDPDDLSLGTVKYEMDFIEEGGEPAVTNRLNNSNVRSFSGIMLIRGFDIEDLAGVAEDMVIDKSTEIDEFVFDDISQLFERKNPGPVC